MKIGIYASEDPTSKTTWSGTPANLISGFKDLDVPMSFFSPSSNTKRSTIARILNSLSQASATYSKIGSSHLSRDLIDHFENSGCDVVIHAAAEHLPVELSSRHLLHATFIDSTFKQFFFPWFHERYQKRSKLMRFFLQFEMDRRNRFYKKSLRSVSHFFVASSWTRDSLVADYEISPDKITVCFTGTGKIDCLSLDRKEIAPRLLFIARHNYISKGARLLLDAFRLIREIHPNAELTIVGPQEEDMGITADEPQVSIHGFLPWEELELLFNQSTIFVMPSEYEPYGLVYLEAMKCGMPVICSATGGMASIVNEQRAGWVVDDLKPHTLAMLLDECLSNPSECSSRGENGRRFVSKNCSWTKCAQIIKNQMESILAGENKHSMQ